MPTLFSWGFALFAMPAQAALPILVPIPVPIGAPSAITISASDVGDNSATLRGSINPNGTNSNTWFEYGTNSGSLSSTIAGPSTGAPISIIKNISGLASNSNFYFRVCASNTWGHNCGSTLSFTTTGGSQQGNVPIVNTQSSSVIDQYSASLNGYVNPNGSGSNSWFEYGTNSYNLSGNVSAGYISSPNQISRSIYNLQPNTTYYFRACASNNWGTNCGSTLSFTTQNNNNGGQQGNSPNAFTDNATNVGVNSATLNAHIDNNGSYSNSWFQYGTSQYSLNLSTNTANQGWYGSSVSQSVAGLQSNTTYYFRVVAQNTFGSSYGSILSFTTLGGQNNSNQMIVVSTPAIVISQTMAKVNGLIIDNGNEQVTAWFEYGPTLAFGNTAQSINLGNVSSQAFSSVLNNLEPGMIYYFRAVAQSSNGIIKGDILTFKTSSVVVPSGGNPSNPPVTPPANNPVSNTSLSKYISLKIETRFENLSAGDAADYDITYKNISNKKIENAILRITLPKEISFNKASEGFFSDSDNTLTVKIDSLDAGKENKISISSLVSKGVKDKDVLVTTATFVYPSPASLVKENVVAYVLNNIVAKNLLPAASIFGNGGFLPNTLTEWLLLTASIFALIFFGRKFYAQIKTPPAPPVA